MESTNSVKKSDCITFVIFTFNEEKRIEWIIRNFNSYGKVLVVDNFSVDKTVEIAKSYGCDIFLNKNKGWAEDFETTEKVKFEVQTEWIYWGSADEMMGQETLTKILEVIRSNEHDVITITRKNYFYGKFLHNAFTSYNNRIFKKSAIDFKGNKIHHFGKIAVDQSRVYKLSNQYFIHHFISNTIETYINSINRYTTIEAEQCDNIARGVVRFILFVFRSIIVDLGARGGYKAGFAGVAFTFILSFNYLTSILKSREKDRGYTTGKIEAANDVHREHLLATLASKIQTT